MNVEASGVVRMGTSADSDLREQVRLRDLARKDRTFWIWAGAGAVWLVLYSALVAVSQGSESFERLVGDGLYLLPLGVAAVLSILAARRVQGRARSMWKVLAASNVAWLLGEIIWSAYSFLDPDGAPSPSAADALYLTSYALAVPAILLGFGHAGSLRQVRGLLDAGLVVIGIGAVGTQFLIRPQLADGADLAVLTSAAYPLLDVVVIACLVSIGLAGHRMVPYSALLVGAAFAAAALSDAGYTYLVVVNELSAGSWINVGWQFQAVLLCLAAVVAIRHGQSDARVQQLDRDLTLVPVLVAATAAFVLVVVDRVQTATVAVETLIVAGVMLVGLVLRQLLFTRDRTRLAERLQVALGEQERLAVTDGLTGLYNRRFLMEMLKLEGDRCTRAGLPLSLVVIDLDHFKNINDTHGHPVGDLVLVQAADRLRQWARNSDFVARYGGEEFIVLLPNTDDEVALELAERFRQALRRSPVTAPGAQAITVTGSVGVATAVAANGEIDVEQLVVEADRALYQAKSRGRDCVAIGGHSDDAPFVPTTDIVPTPVAVGRI
jgi:diguanylate cyclase (GGDEF)-like protein